MRIRRVVGDDEETLWRALYVASHAEEEPTVRPADQRADPGLAPYVAGWGRVGDLGLVALDEDGEPLGAAWLRVLGGPVAVVANDEPGLPELAIAVFPGNEGAGIGTALLEQLLELAIGEHRGVVLSVRVGNPARRLYERMGFLDVGHITNRVGTESVVMRLLFDHG